MMCGKLSQADHSLKRRRVVCIAAVEEANDMRKYASSLQKIIGQIHISTVAKSSFESLHSALQVEPYIKKYSLPTDMYSGIHEGLVLEKVSTGDARLRSNS